MVRTSHWTSLSRARSTTSDTSATTATTANGGYECVAATAAAPSQSNRTPGFSSAGERHAIRYRIQRIRFFSAHMRWQLPIPPRLNFRESLRSTRAIIGLTAGSSSTGSCLMCGNRELARLVAGELPADGSVPPEWSSSNAHFLGCSGCDVRAGRCRCDPLRLSSCYLIALRGTAQSRSQLCQSRSSGRR